MVDIGGLINRLAPLIGETVTQEYSVFVNSKTEAQKLSSNLKEIEMMLEEAEKRRLTDPRVKSWLERLQSVMYEIDDALDESESASFGIPIFEYDEIDDDDDDDGGCERGVLCNWVGKVGLFAFNLCLRFMNFCNRREVLLNIKALNEKVESIAKETAKYSTLLPISSDSPDTKPKFTTSYSQLIALENQDHEKNKIVKELLTCKDLAGDVRVISLVGMAGIGKTTLAQLAFHDPGVRSSFQLRSWICLSHTCDEVRVTKAILQSLDVIYPEDADLHKLLKILHSFASGKKLLLVLDNVWSEDSSFWRQLKGSLVYGKALESVILVTSRNENVAKSMGSTRIIKVKRLSDPDCWLLFKEIAFQGMEKDDRESLASIGQGIAKKCEGFPLAAETLGSYLRSRYSKQLWEDVLEKELWELEEVAEALFAPFAFSYNELPLALKHCFSYCGIYAERTEGTLIDVGDLIRLWMMQGYLIASDGTDDDMELKGMDYFEKLVARSFFEYVSKDDSKKYYESCSLHSVVLNFALYLKETAGRGMEERRTLAIDFEGHSWNHLDLLKSARVLFVLGVEKHELPLRIADLVHLRYLQLSETLIKKLPISICYLYNLHTLDLWYCTELSELPKRIHMLKNLRHLVLEGTYRLERVPEGVGKLIHLRTLDEFKVGRGRSKLRYLADLNQIRGSMRIYIGDLNEEEDAEDAKKAQLGNKIYITDLALIFDGEDVRLDVMEALQLPPNLHYLYLEGYRATQLPGWINAATSLKKLRYLTLSLFDKCLHLPPLGTLPCLEELSVSFMQSLERVGCEFLGIRDDRNDSPLLEEPLFPKLRKLWFWHCNSWKEWEDSTGHEGCSKNLSIMPCLQTLTINNCPRLKTLPHFLPGGIEFTTDGDLVLPTTSSPAKER